ncbi:restriction endonuclease subunit S [Desulfitobacterium chlororespirans]|uniref:restriction endonuclease subunit S n=1 Tax=Desulfitobacterium chlororespirans TaxID=51616 RepID=UPI0015B5792A|nr:restriction endonuclease subunit S [Desulfitobacterium chlororespirans]
MRVKKGQILVTCSGTIGKVALVSRTLDKQIFSHDLIRINVKNPADVGFIYAFLRSETGNTLLQTNRYGSVIQHIEPDHLADIPVPNPADKIKTKISDLVIRSYDLRDRSNELIDKATAMLVDALCLPPISKLKTERFCDEYETNNYNVKLSDLGGRLDGSYHLPITKAITAHLQRYAGELTTVGDERISKNIILPGRFKRVYVEKGQGRAFFGGKQLYELDPTNKKYLSLTQHGDRIKEQLELHENMILITRSGTIGKVTIVPKHWEHWVASEHIIRVIPASNEIAGYLSIFLASEYGYPLIRRFTYGSVVDEIDERHVAKIPFPLLKAKAVQDEIACIALEANAFRYEAYRLEQEALQIMNDEVIFS